jgi:small GTP-binding protein
MNEKPLHFDEFIDRSQRELYKAWDGLPEETRAGLVKALGLLPGDVKGWRGLIDQSMENLRMAAGEKHKVAIVGPANVGKSTLYNQFVRDKDAQADVSAVPGTTRVSQEADAGIFAVIDTPGADAIGAVGKAEKERALLAAQGADVLVLLFDATHGVREPERKLFQDLSALDIPLLVALNKMDVIAKERPAIIGKAAAGLGIPSDQLIPISAKKSDGLEALLLAIAKSEPAIIAALGQALPAYRWMLAQGVIGRAASTAAAIAATPLPFLDFIPLIAIQATMVMGIARIYAYRITLARARELIVSFGLGVLGRTLFYELSKLGGPPGWVLAAAVAAGTTTAMGYAAAVWFERGERLSKEAMSRITRAFTETVVARIKTLGRRRPDRKTLRERVGQALDELPTPDVEDEQSGG